MRFTVERAILPITDGAVVTVDNWHNLHKTTENQMVSSSDLVQVLLVATGIFSVISDNVTQKCKNKLEWKSKAALHFF